MSQAERVKILSLALDEAVIIRDMKTLQNILNFCQ